MTSYVIQVDDRYCQTPEDRNRNPPIWVDWNLAGGGDFIEFTSEECARETGISAGLVRSSEGISWRVVSR